MKQKTIVILITVVVILVLAFYFGRKLRRANLNPLTPSYAYILTTQMVIQKVNYLLPFSPKSRQKSIFIETEAGQEVKKLAPCEINYLVRKNDDDYLAILKNGKTYSIVLGDGEVSFWPIYEGLNPPSEIAVSSILAISWTSDGLEKAKTDRNVQATLKKLRIDAEGEKQREQELFNQSAPANQ